MGGLLVSGAGWRWKLMYPVSFLSPCRMVCILSYSVLCTIVLGEYLGP
jgi:hypothetical protein